MLSDTQVDGTFTDFANEIRFYKNGEYQLTRNYTFNKDIDIDLVSGISIKESIIDGQGHTFNGNSESRIFKINAGENKTIILKNIIFINGNGRFESTYGTGGALTVSGSGDVTIINSTFIDNKAYSGGAIYSGGNINHPLKIFDSTFESNKAFQFGAAFNGNCVLFDNCSFNGNRLSDFSGDGYGGSAIFGQYNIQILNSNFTNNYVYNGRGTVYFYGSNNIISGCIFYNNTARSNAGVYHSSGSGVALRGDVRNVEVSNSKFINGSPQVIWSDKRDGVFNPGIVFNNLTFTGTASGYDMNLAFNSAITNCTFNTQKAIYAPNAFLSLNGNIGLNSSNLVYKGDLPDYDIFYVGPNAQGNGTSENDLCSLQYALDNSLPGYKIYLTEGTYTDINQIYVLSTVDIIGKGNVIIDLSNSIYGLNIVAKDVLIDNIQFIVKNQNYHKNFSIHFS